MEEVFKKFVKLYKERNSRISTFFMGEDSVRYDFFPVSYTHLRAHETVLDIVCRLLLEKKQK